MTQLYPCDIDDSCPYSASTGMDCYNHCGLGADENGGPEAGLGDCLPLIIAEGASAPVDE
jgi:hypothetical protein